MSQQFTCGNCAYFERERCHRFPPTPTSENDYRPTVKSHDWCGEHSALQLQWAEHDPDTGRLTRILRALPESER